MALKSVTYKGKEFNISYTLHNPQAKKDIVFLHGWGSNKELMNGSFATILPDMRHIYIDMPGFGKSSCDTILTTQDYAAILELFFQEVGVSKEIILGHSFGGKVATLLNPELLVLVASAGIVVPKSFSVKTKITLFKLLKNLGLSKMRSLFVAEDAKELSHEMYETFKNVVDEDFSQKFQAREKQTLLFWGKADSATPLSSAKKIEQLCKKSSLKVYEGDHYFFMKHAEDIGKNIEHYLP